MVGMARHGIRGIGETQMIGGMVLDKQTGRGSGKAMTARLGLSSSGKEDAPGPESNDPGAPTCHLGIMDQLERKAKAREKAQEKRELLRVLPRRSRIRLSLMTTRAQKEP